MLFLNEVKILLEVIGFEMIKSGQLFLGCRLIMKALHVNRKK
jgi:hypothetical protein